MTINIALMGAGRIGKVHARAISTEPRARLVAVSDPMTEAAQAIAQPAGAQLMGFDDILADSNIDAAMICTPTDQHADQIEALAKAGKAIFCEKPIDLSLPRVQQVLATLKQTGVPFMLAFNRRFDPHFLAMKAQLDSGALGAVEMVNIISRDPAAPPYEYISVSGGIFRDMTIHDIDMARFLLGEEIDMVYAQASVLTDPKIGELGDFDSANLILTTASGKQASISNSRRATYGYDQRIEVHCAGGLVSTGNPPVSTVSVAGAQGFRTPALHDFFMTRYIDAYAGEVAEFIDAIDAGRQPSPNAEDGFKALSIAEAALLSVREKRAVKLSEILA